MHSLRCYYNTQRNEVKATEGTGVSTDTFYKPRLQFYESLSVLNDMVVPRKTMSNIDDDVVYADEENEDVYVPVPPAPPKKLPKKRHVSNVIEQSMSHSFIQTPCFLLFFQRFVDIHMPTKWWTRQQ